MNLIKKSFCRVFQFAFHAALPVLPYREPILFTEISQLEPLFQKLDTRSVLLVTDKFLRESGVTKPLEELLSRKGINLAVYDKTRSNPTVQNVCEARNMYINEKCSVIIAFGGGSPMDCAKGTGVLIAYPKKRIEDLRGNLRVLRKLPPLIAVPTTAGTGSEVTLSAVITDPEKTHKFVINSFSLIPRYAVLDASVTFSLPQNITSITGMDALTHAVEAYIGRSTSSETRQKALEATKLIFENIETAYNQPTNRDARANMLRAAYLAGIAFSKSYVGYVHAVAHSLGGQYNIPHGLANSVLLPIVLEDYGTAAHKKLHELGVVAGVCGAHDSHNEGAVKFIKAIRELNRRINIPETLSGIKKEDIPTMARHADHEANPLYPVPVLMNAGELEKFYYKVADWNNNEKH